MSASLTILCRCPLPRLPHPPPVVQQWLKTVLSWNYWEDPESAEEDIDDWHSVTKTEQPPVIKCAVCCLISPAVLCLTLSVFVSGDLRTASGPPDTRPRPRWTAFSLQEKKVNVMQVHLFLTTSYSIKWPGLVTLRDPPRKERHLVSNVTDKELKVDKMCEDEGRLSLSLYVIWHHKKVNRSPLFCC